MAEGNPITYVNGLHANNDAKFFEDVYIYGNLYYDLDGQDNFKVDNLIVNSQSDLNNLYVSGITTLAGPNIFSGGSYFTGITSCCHNYYPCLLYFFHDFNLCLFLGLLLVELPILVLFLTGVKYSFPTFLAIILLLLVHLLMIQMDFQPMPHKYKYLRYHY